jgi:hypothetical protein
MIGRAALSSLLLVVVAVAMPTALKDWAANLTPLGESTVRGTATISTLPGDSLAIGIMIENARMGDEHPWHLHSGSCPRSGAVIADESSYPLIRVADDKAGSASALVAAVLHEGSTYSINVHRSPNDHTAIACGDLKPILGGGEAR